MEGRFHSFYCLRGLGGIPISQLEVCEMDGVLCVNCGEGRRRETTESDQADHGGHN